jgi:Protein of unknown function (DUF2934)
MPKKRTAEKEIVMPSAASAVPLRRKPAPRTRVTRSVEPAATAAASIAEPATGAVETVAAPTVSAPSYQEIAQLAYTFWEARGGQGGSQEEDWLRAEEQLRARVSTVTA